MQQFSFQYKVLTEQDISEIERLCITQSRLKCKDAYAPYSHFHVAATVLLENGEMLSGTNIENASYPVGICAERSVLATAHNVYPDVKINAMFISYQSTTQENDKAIYPCGFCRQFLLEIEEKQKQAIVLFLSGQKGEIIKLNSCKDLLPFGFSGEQL